MSIEEKLQKYILSRYRSIRDFTIAHDIPYMTVKSVFKRGVNNSSVSTIIKICKPLGLSVDGLADGEITPLNHKRHNKNHNKNHNKIENHNIIKNNDS